MGRIYSKRLPQGNYAAPNAYRLALNGISERGNLVRFSLGEYRRYGILTKCEWEEKTLGDIEYKLTFVVSGPTPPRNYQVLTDPKPDTEADNNLLKLETEFFTVNYGVNDDIDQTIAERLNEYVSEVAGAVASVTSFVDSVISVAENIEQSAVRALGLITVAKASISTFSRRIRGLSFTALTTLGVTTRYATIARVQDAISVTGNLSVYLSRLQAQFERIRNTVPIARYVVKTGDTLQRIAVRFYGNAELWSKIYDHNKLTTTLIAPPQILEIPRV